MDWARSLEKAQGTRHKKGPRRKGRKKKKEKIKGYQNVSTFHKRSDLST